MNGLTVYKKEGQSPIQSKKIKELLRPEIGLVVKYICTITGITKVPEGYDSTVLIDFMLNKYGNHGILEFKTAFDMYVEGKLPKRDNESHYNTISAAFIGSVMQKYQTHRAKEIQKLNLERDKQPTPKAKYTNLDFENAYNYAVGYISKNNKLPIGGHWLHIYDHFKIKRMGWYGLEDNARIASKNEFVLIVRSQLKAEAREGNAGAELAKTALNNKGAFATMCKSRYAKKELTKLIK